jgi:hypothetical protein
MTTDQQTNEIIFSIPEKKAHLRRTGELDAIPPDELDTTTILLVKAHGDLSMYGGFAVLVAGEPDVL